MEILGSAYLSELKGRVSVTPNESRESSVKRITAEHPEDPISAITRELMKTLSIDCTASERSVPIIRGLFLSRSIDRPPEILSLLGNSTLRAN